MPFEKSPVRANTLRKLLATRMRKGKTGNPSLYSPVKIPSKHQTLVSLSNRWVRISFIWVWKPWTCAWTWYKYLCYWYRSSALTSTSKSEVRQLFRDQLLWGPSSIFSKSSSQTPGACFLSLHTTNNRILNKNTIKTRKVFLRSRNSFGKWNVRKLFIAGLSSYLYPSSFLVQSWKKIILVRCIIRLKTTSRGLGWRFRKKIDQGPQSHWFRNTGMIGV
jgi:hypothetical protein